MQRRLLRKGALLKGGLAERSILRGCLAEVVVEAPLCVNGSHWSSQCEFLSGETLFRAASLEAKLEVYTRTNSTQGQQEW